MSTGRRAGMLWCKKHQQWAYPYIVCSHVVNDGAIATKHVMFDGTSGQVLCDRKHWPPAPGDKKPSVMCENCASEFLRP